MFSTNYNLRLTIMEDGKVGVNTTAPNSKLEVNGSLSMPLRQVDALQDNLTYNITDDDYTIVANMQGLAVAGRVMNLVLPSPVGRKGRLYNITALNLGQNSSNLAGGVRIFVNSVVAGTQIWTLQFRIYPDLSIISFDSMVTLQSDGAQWLPVSSNHYQHPYQP
jgi:hypothetical protein